jgi:predicted GIY-YIG superfamily endonuclease
MRNYHERMWYVYIARARTGRYYVGMTTDSYARIDKHNNLLGSRLAVQQRPFTLAYVSQPFEDKSAARRREEQIKGWSRIKKEKLISGEWK